VSKIEKQEKIDREAQKKKELEEGQLYAERLHIEQVDEAMSTKLQAQDDKSYKEYKDVSERALFEHPPGPPGTLRTPRRGHHTV